MVFLLPTAQAQTVPEQRSLCACLGRRSPAQILRLRAHRRETIARAGAMPAVTPRAPVGTKVAEGRPTTREGIMDTNTRLKLMKQLRASIEQIASTVVEAGSQRMLQRVRALLWSAHDELERAMPQQQICL
jgi:hypothetical protein